MLPEKFQFMFEVFHQPDRRLSCVIIISSQKKNDQLRVGNVSIAKEGCLLVGLLVPYPFQFIFDLIKELFDFLGIFIVRFIHSVNFLQCLLSIFQAQFTQLRCDQRRQVGVVATFFIIVILTFPRTRFAAPPPSRTNRIRRLLQKKVSGRCVVFGGGRGYSVWSFIYWNVATSDHAAPSIIDTTVVDILMETDRIVTAVGALKRRSSFHL
mmetsp:Transcript_4588/g.10012  ORF Transcript_4588/g.10012 Transcript_4588/m.10012 type:complete len:210 (-) Transcript_4588:280-909(-)